MRTRWKRKSASAKPEATTASEAAAPGSALSAPIRRSGTIPRQAYRDPECCGAPHVRRRRPYTPVEKALELARGEIVQEPSGRFVGAARARRWNLTPGERVGCVLAALVALDTVKNRGVIHPVDRKPANDNERHHSVESRAQRKQEAN